MLARALGLAEWFVREGHQACRADLERLQARAPPPLRGTLASETLGQDKSSPAIQASQIQQPAPSPGTNFGSTGVPRS